mgnify:CR=1 FL=1
MITYPQTEHLPENLSRNPAWITVFRVPYLHLCFEDGTELYVTEYGLPFLRQLLPQNHWGDREWAASNRQKLPGTSTLYHLRTKEVNGVAKDVVLKWNRMGQDIPGETEASELSTAQFNSPFEEFGLVTELRKSTAQVSASPRTHKPLAIFVPRKIVEPEQLGRRHWRFEKVAENHTEVTLESNRNYAVIYEWIKGIDAAEGMRRDAITQEDVDTLVMDANRQLAEQGFRIKDNKPHHLILRPTRHGGFARDTHGNMLYALVDFELLERTPQHEREVRASRRRIYVSRQPHRFEKRREMPPGLNQRSIMGVDYVYGRVESSTGALLDCWGRSGFVRLFSPRKMA